jgi:hypothetical protein
MAQTNGDPVSDEPLYCSTCGQECCDHDLDAVGPYCETCGVIPASGKECYFHKQGGRPEPCESQ